MIPTLLVALALLAQFLSGAAAIVNQTVWQRALLVHLAGSAATSAMIVVFAFMAGLGAGALWVGRTADRIKNPARALGLLEVGLAGVNLVVLGLLSLDARQSLEALQRATVSIGVPLPLLYASVSLVVLLGPCFLMGASSPLMSELAQRQLGRRDNRFLVVLFFVNTIGACAGGLATGFALLPRWGQRGCLGLAIGLNLVAAVLILAMQRLPATRAAAPAESSPLPVSAAPRRMEVLAFALGLLSLLYEMYLYRVVPLTFEPKPYTFATVLSAFLFFWSVGVLLARFVPWPLAWTLVLCAFSVLAAPLLAARGGWPLTMGLRHLALAGVFWLPCLGFGAAFGQLVIQVARQWGNDVGRFYGWNTIGSCLGIGLGVLVGYQFHPAFTVFVIAAGYLGLLVFEARDTPGTVSPARGRALLVAGAVVFGLLGSEILALQSTQTTDRASGGRTYYGHEGVVEVTPDGAMFWNGLGHAPLSRGGSHVGEGDWRQAVAPLLVHAPGRDMEALVVGLGAGATGATLALSDSVRNVDIYEINPGLRQFLADYPEGTLHVASSPKIRLIWEDGRTGLTVSPKQYDVVTQAPLYLKQAGSSILLSREYMELVKSRLKPGGVFAIYCNAQGRQAQALVVRQTAARVFRYGESFAGGYLLVVSDAPIEWDEATLRARLEAAGPADPFAAQVRSFGVEKVAALIDRPRLPWEGSPVVVSDDQPVVEYPDIVDDLVRRHASTGPSASRPGPPPGYNSVAMAAPASAGPAGSPATSPATDPAPSDPTAPARERMVAEQIAARGVADPRVLDALRKVPRHLFVPAKEAGEAYSDHPLPIGHGQTISQPYIVAFMTEALGLRGGEKVFEVGTGSGYQAAVLAELGATVHTVEIVAPLAEEAKTRLARLGYANVHVRAGDGYAGWPEAAPFDAVIVTAAAPRVPEPLMAQLKDGGRLVIPVGDEAEGQELLLLTRRGDRFDERRLLPVRFVPMTGAVRKPKAR